MKFRFPRKWCLSLVLIAIPCVFFYLGRYSVRLFDQLTDYAKYRFPVAVFLFVGVTISIALFWKSQLFTKRLRKLISFILIVLIAGCFTFYYLAAVVDSDLDKDVYVPEVQDLGGAYYQTISESVNHQSKFKKDLSWKQIYNMYSPAVVLIEGKRNSGKSTGRAGTGFLINEDGVILTNFHILEDAYAATVTLTDQNQYQAFVLAKNKEMDFLVLKIKGNKFPCVVLGDSDTAEVADEVATIGNPMSLENSFANGIVSGVNRKRYDQVWLQTTIPMSPGNSGGPVFNSHGEVIGIMTETIRGEPISLAIPINQVLSQCKKTLALQR